VFGPNCLDLRVGCEFTARGGAPGRVDCSPFVGRKCNWPGFIACAGEMQYDPGNLVLSIRRESACDLEGLIE
jgi:hypothetical protein